MNWDSRWNISKIHETYFTSASDLMFPLLVEPELNPTFSTCLFFAQSPLIGPVIFRPAENNSDWYGVGILIWICMISGGFFLQSSCLAELASSSCFKQWTECFPINSGSACYFCVCVCFCTKDKKPTFCFLHKISSANHLLAVAGPGQCQNKYFSKF